MDLNFPSFLCEPSQKGCSLDKPHEHHQYSPSSSSSTEGERDAITGFFISETSMRFGVIVAEDTVDVELRGNDSKKENCKHDYGYQQQGQFKFAVSNFRIVYEFHDIKLPQ